MRCLPVSLSLSGRRLPTRCAPLRALPVHWARQKKPQNAGASTSDFSIFVCSSILYCSNAMEAYAVCSHIEGSLTLSIFISQPSKLATPYRWHLFRLFSRGPNREGRLCARIDIYAIHQNPYPSPTHRQNPPAPRKKHPPVANENSRCTFLQLHCTLQLTYSPAAQR